MSGAVEVSSAYKFYKNGKDINIVLNHLNMKVKYSCMYALMGPSGCGKTTLLNCILGLKNVDKGELLVLGGKPRAGPQIGYSPQSISLIQEFTVREIIFYFARIYGMYSEMIEYQFTRLKSLLDLPDENRYIKECSQGQQRCVSFIISVIHSPKLIILDEPTVGLDPLLRENIWSFLKDLTRVNKSTVILTSHYIEECTQANYAGIMRDGIILAEDSPFNIMEKTNTSRLEEAFIKLCVNTDNISWTSHHHSTMCDSILSSDSSNVKLAHDSNMIELQYSTKRKIKTLLRKNFITTWRNKTSMIFLFLSPLIQIILLFTAIGRTPKDLKIGIVSDELVNSHDCNNSTYNFHNNFTCELKKVSCIFISHISSENFEKHYFKNFEEAYESASKAEIWGFIYFASNFTESLVEVRDEGRYSTDEAFENSEIKVYLDKTNQYITHFIERILLDTYHEFSENLMTICNLPVKLGNIPVVFEKPIYGSFDDEFIHFMAPGIIFTIIFFTATTLATSTFINDRLEGIWNRSLVAGISASEMVVAHVLTESIIVVIQSMECISIAVYILDIKNHGDNYTIIFMLLLLGFSGMAFGMLISIISNSYTTANFMSTGTFFPMVILCGILWPISGMPKLLQYIAKLMPFTLPTISARNILHKGWSVISISVMKGYLVTISWTLIFMLLCFIVLKHKKS